MKLKILFISIICILFPLNVDASFLVEHVTKDSSTKIGDYNTYEEAYKVMNEYNSTSQDVAVIKENNKIINAKYAVVKLKSDPSFPWAENSNNEHRIFLTNTSSTVYTTIHAAYGNDAAFISYDPYAKNSSTNGRVQLKISGLTGWINAPYVDIIPISVIAKNGYVASKDSTWFKEIGNNQIQTVSASTINIRNGATTSSPIVGTTNYGNIYTYKNKTHDGTYTWYEIELSSSLSTHYQVNSGGNLIHNFATFNTVGTTNLGKAPSYLKQNTKYYSFDGNYFYTNITSMLKDYKDNKIERAVNALSPHYAYYLYLSNHSKTKYTSNDFNLLISSKGYNGDKNSGNYSAMYNQGDNFIKSQNTYGINALLTFSAAVNESNYGKSAIAKDKNNLFGHHAFGANPYENATTYNKVHDSIMEHARLTGNGYNDPSKSLYFGGHYGNKNSGMNVKYATDPYWGEKMASNAFNSDSNFGLQEFAGNTLGITTKLNVNVKKEPTYSSSTIYTLKNIDTAVKDMPLTVIDKVNYNNQNWYKVYTDSALDDNQNINKDINYDFNKSYGYINENELYVLNNQPVITASDKIVTVGTTNIDLFKDVKAHDKEDGDITGSLVIDEKSDKIKVNIPGDYYITYKVTDKSQFSVSKKIKVTVAGEIKPVIEAKDITLIQYKDYDLMDYVKAIDPEEGDITNKVKITNNIDINKEGIYKVTYTVTNKDNKQTTKDIKVTVIENEKPVITVTNKEAKYKSKFNPLDGVTATDKEDGELEVKIISSSVDTSKQGDYIVIYSATDKDNQTTVETVQITVVEKSLLEKESLYYIDYIKEVNNKLTIKGYNAITGIDNDLKTDIKYYIQFVDIETLEVKFTKNAQRITDKKEMTMPVFATDNKDYTYSWFNYTFDLNDIKSGNYRLYIVSESEDYYSKSIISNKMFVPQITHFKGEKVVTTKNNYSISSSPVEFIIRDKEIAPKTTNIYTYNQFDQYLDLKFDNNKLYINGTSYSYNMDLSNKQNIKRNIIFENKKTYEKIKYELGSETGPYIPVLPVDDKLSKEKAWYKKSIDISNIEKGTYNIYISNESNISDYSEFKDLFNRDLSNIKATINDKDYSFNLNKFNNIELIVK